MDPGMQINFSQNTTIPVEYYSEFKICGIIPTTATEGSIVSYQVNGDPGGYNNTNEGGDNPANNGTVQGVLPIELLSFEAFPGKDDVKLKWKTATELNNSHFDIERSGDGRNYSKIGEVKGAGTTNQVISYVFTDDSPVSRQNYYRLKQVDFDGAYEYGPVEVVTFGGSSDLTIFPNPVSPGSGINIQGQKIRTVKIYNMLGQLVVEKVYDRPQTSVTISSANLAQGVYTTRVNGVDEKRVVIK